MPWYRRTYELNVRSLIMRQRLKQMLDVQLCFHPYKNPMVSASLFTDLLRADFDYFTNELDIEDDDCGGLILVHIARLLSGQDGVPYMRHDSVLGPLKWDRSLWEGEFEWRLGRLISLQMWTQYSPGFLSRIRRAALGPPLPSVAMARAKTILPQLDRFDHEWREGAVHKLLTLFNKEWNDGPQMSADDFHSKLSLQALEFQEDGAARVRYYPSGIFTDHDVRLDLNESLAVESATIEG